MSPIDEINLVSWAYLIGIVALSIACILSVIEAKQKITKAIADCARGPLEFFEKKEKELRKTGSPLPNYEEAAQLRTIVDYAKQKMLGPDVVREIENKKHTSQISIGLRACLRSFHYERKKGQRNEL